MTAGLSWAALAVAVVFVLLSAVSDAKRYLIPNKYTLSILLAGVAFGIVNTPGFDWVSHGGAALIVFLVGALMFNLGLFGGGDVKMLTALSFWAGLDELMPFLVLVALAGGAMSILAVLWFWFQRWRCKKDSVEASETVLTLFAATQSSSVAEVAQTAKTFRKFAFMKLRVPYGIAIAAGSVYVFLRIVGQLGSVAA